MATEEKEARNTDDIEASIVEYFYERQVSGHRCGYCKSGDTFVSNGMWGHRLAGQDYQDLIERGWRRSGKYLYKPIMNRTCCPPYAIRCEALRFKPTRSQRKVARRMRAFLVEGKTSQRANRVKSQETKENEKKEKDSAKVEVDGTANGANAEEKKEVKEEDGVKTEDPEKEDGKMKDREDTKEEDENAKKTVDPGEEGGNVNGRETKDPEEGGGTAKNSRDYPETVVTETVQEEKKESVAEVPSRKKARKVPRPGVGADPNIPRCRKAKELRQERRNKKLAASEPKEGETVGESNSEQAASVGEESKAKEGEAEESSDMKSSKAESGDAGESSNTVESKATESEAMDTGDKNDDTAKETMEEKNGERKEEKEDKTQVETTESEQHGESASAEEPKPKIDAELSQPHVSVEELLKLPSDQTMAHQLELKVVDCYPLTQELMSSFIESYYLYKKYQMAVHGDKEEDLSERSYRRFLCDTPLVSLDGPLGWDYKYGSFHFQYFLDGKLVMVAVVDILPTYLSSVYVYYDPDYSWLDLGVYSALREIELVRKLNKIKPEFQYYCMGYYIHDNAKMNYKGKYSPSYLLCPDTYRFTPIESARQRFDKSKYSRLNDDQYTAERVLSFLGGVLILFEKQVIPYMLFRSYYGHIKDRIVVEYASLVGKAITQRMFLYLLLDGREHEEEDSDD